jgi:hypothetical protein
LSGESSFFDGKDLERSSCEKLDKENNEKRREIKRGCRFTVYRLVRDAKITN